MPGAASPISQPFSNFSRSGGLPCLICPVSHVGFLSSVTIYCSSSTSVVSAGCSAAALPCQVPRGGGGLWIPPFGCWFPAPTGLGPVSSFSRVSPPGSLRRVSIGHPVPSAACSLPSAKAFNLCGHSAKQQTHAHGSELSFHCEEPVRVFQLHHGRIS